MPTLPGRSRVVRARRLLGVLVLLAASSGCYGSIGRGVATGASGALYERRDTLGMIAGDVADSAVARAVQSVLTQLKGPLDSALASIVDSVGERAMYREGELTRQLSTDLAKIVDSVFARTAVGVEDLFARNGPLIRDSVNAFIGEWMQTASAAARATMIPLMTDAVDSVTTRLMDRLSGALTGDLRDDIVDLAFSLADTLQTSVEEPFLALGRAATIASIGFLMLIIATVAILLTAVRRSRKALDVVTDAVREWSEETSRAGEAPPRHTNLAEVIVERARESHLDTRRLSRVIDAAAMLDYHEGSRTQVDQAEIE